MPDDFSRRDEVQLIKRSKKGENSKTNFHVQGVPAEPGRQSQGSHSGWRPLAAILPSSGRLWVLKTGLAAAAT